MQTATVSIDEKFDVAGDPDRVWSLITDPLVVANCVPGAQIRSVRDDGTLDGVLVVRLGPTEVEFQGEVVPNFAAASRRGELIATGSDKGGRTRAKATTTFAVDQGATSGTSTVALGGHIDVSGGLAPFARTGGTHITRRLVGEFASNLAEHIRRDVEQGSAAGMDDSQPASAPIRGFRLLLMTLLDVVKSAGKRAGSWLRHKTPSEQSEK